jgi:hypothetical protein
MKNFFRQLWDSDVAMMAIVICLGMFLAWYVGAQL